MTQRCKTCSHDQRDEIEKLILAGKSYRSIARQFKIGNTSVLAHARNHLKPIIDAANEAAQQQITEKITKYRSEVNYPVLDKVKLLQDRILNDLDAVFLAADRVPLYRELRGALQEESKLAGLYQKDRANEADLAKCVRGYQKWLHDYPDASDEDRQQWLEWFADSGGVDREELAKQVRIQELGNTLQ